jgi:PAS domain S-box-containing protein
MICRYLPGSAIITFVNDANCRNAGRTREDLLGKSIVDLAPASDRERLRAYFASLAADPRTAEIEHEVVLPDGTTGWEHWVDHPIFDAAGNVVEFQGIGRDVTDRVRAEEALAESRRLADRVGAASPDILYVFDVLDSRTVYVNDAIGRVLGYAPEQLTEAENADPMAMRHPDDRATLEAAVARVAAAADGEVVEFAFRMRHADGGWRWLAARATVLAREPDGRPRLVVGAASDVTVLRETEAALRESEARYREVVDLQTELVARFLPDTTLTFVNDAYCRFFGRTKDELLGTRFLELDPPWTHETTLARVATIGRNPEPVSVEHEEYLPDGSLGWVQWNNRAIRDADGNLIELQTVGRDVTELRRAEEALRASETKLRLALENAAMGTWDWNVGADWIAWSDGSGPLCGLPAGTAGVSTEQFYARVHPDDRARLQAEVEQRAEDAADIAVEFRVVWPDGSIHWLERRGRAIAHDTDGRATRFLGVTTDVTARKQSEATLRRLSHQLLKLQDEERRRLARELHDGVAQDVFAVTVALDSIGRSAQRLDSPSRETLTEAQSLAEQVLRSLRTQVYLLHPPVLDIAGLAPALREYAVGLSRRGDFEVDATAVEDVGRLPAEVETALFRVAQEALSNVAKHAATDRATLTLRSEDGRVELRVADQGRGRLANEIPHGRLSIGVGIPGMRERLRQIGGELDIASGPGWTTVTAQAPVALSPS